MASANIISDKFTGQSRGFGFVEMSSQEEATAAIEALNSTEFGGRTLTVNKARPQAPRTGGGRGDLVGVKAEALATNAAAASKTNIDTVHKKEEKSDNLSSFLFP